METMDRLGGGGLSTGGRTASSSAEITSSSFLYQVNEYLRLGFVLQQWKAITFAVG